MFHGQISSNIYRSNDRLNVALEKFLEPLKPHATVDICRYENLESLGKSFVPFVSMHLPRKFQGN